jgi:hypothetical protein
MGVSFGLVGLYELLARKTLYHLVLELNHRDQGKSTEMISPSSFYLSDNFIDCVAYFFENLQTFCNLSNDIPQPRSWPSP